MNVPRLSCLVVTFLFVSLQIKGQEAIPTDQNSLKILSWNIFMRPSVLPGLAKKPRKRSQAILDTLSKLDYDVIIFQEAFNSRAIKILSKLVSDDQYPYHVGPVNRKKTKTSNSSGVWLLSKYPFSLIDSVQFNTAKGSDKLAKKGAVLVEVEKAGQAFQIIGTHVQATEAYEHRLIRESQFMQIKNELLVREKEGVPQLLLGDFNTVGPCLPPYLKMLEIFDAKDEPPVSGNYTYDAVKNDLGSGGDRQLLDYALIRENGLALRVERYIRKFRKEGWSKKKSDLSDHYAIELEVSW